VEQKKGSWTVLWRSYLHGRAYDCEDCRNEKRQPSTEFVG